MLCEPMASVEVMKVATPPVSVGLPRMVEPSWNVTVPVGAPAPGLTTATVAVRVTDCPKTDEEGLALRDVVVPAWLTVCEAIAEVLPVKLASPRYWAVIECVPTASPAVL